MPHRYLQELVTPSVAAAQERYGSRTAVERTTSGWDTDGLLGPDETAFLAARDGFYLATVGETGWPYVQYRGGPPGFVHVLTPAEAAPLAEDDPGRSSVLAWADFRGNRQYVSVGNLGAGSRVSLFFMDYPGRRRLKILGTATVIDVRTPDGRVAGLLGRLVEPGYRATVERVVAVQVVGYDWNCPQHITPRWTEAELEATLAPVSAELAALRAENAALRALAVGS